MLASPTIIIIIIKLHEDGRISESNERNLIGEERNWIGRISRTRNVEDDTVNRHGGERQK